MNMRSLIVLLFLFPLNNSEGQARFVEGIVIESYTKEPLIYASVYHPGTKSHCYTDLYGKFSIELTGSGKTYLYIHYTGFECKIQEVDYNEKLVEIALEMGHMIPPMVILEYKNPNSANKTPMDSISQLCNRYQHEIDSILSIHNRIKK